MEAILSSTCTAYKQKNVCWLCSYLCVIFRIWRPGFRSAIVPTPNHAGSIIKVRHRQWRPPNRLQVLQCSLKSTAPTSKTRKEGISLSRIVFNTRVLTLRGVNLGSDAKNPTKPFLPSHIKDGLFDADDVSFVGAPFALKDADEHLGRIKGYGFNVVRFVFTWEALEHSGP